MVREAAAELAGKGVVVQVNTQENPSLATRFGIRGIPAIVALRQGKTIGQLSGAQDKNTLLNWFKGHSQR